MSSDRIVVAYATRHGQARRIAEYVAREMGTWGWASDLVNVAEQPAVDWADYRGAILVASVHIGHHEKEMIAFVKGGRPALDRLPNAFLSVTLTEAGVEDPKATEASRHKAAADVQMMVDTFMADTGWRPQHVVPVAGALMYTKYNPLIRFVMKRIARKAGASTDTTHDAEFTDWAALGRFTKSFASDLRALRGVA